MKWLKLFKPPVFFKAAVYKKFGKSSEVVELINKPLPQKLSKDTFLVKMHAASINPSDLLTIKGVYSYRIELPKIGGFEGVGTVVAVQNNKHVDYLGKRVLAIKGIGTWQEYNVVPASEAILVPKQITDSYASQLYINPLTVWVMLTEKLNIMKDDWLLINAGNSACGYIISALAKAWNFNLISIVRRKEAKIQLKKLGVKYVIDSENEDIALKVKKYTGWSQIDFALDAVGGEVGGIFADLVKPKGSILQYGLMSGKLLKSDFFKKVKMKEINFNFFHLRDWVYKKEIKSRKKVFEEMIKKFVELEIELPKSYIFQFKDIEKALLKAEQEKRDGKVILCFDNDEESKNLSGESEFLELEL